MLRVVWESLSRSLPGFLFKILQLLGGGALSKIGARSERKLQLRSLKLSQMRHAVVGSATRKPLSVIKNPFSFGSNGPMGLGNKTMSTIGSSNGGQIHFQASTSTRIPESEKSSN